MVPSRLDGHKNPTVSFIWRLLSVFLKFCDLIFKTVLLDLRESLLWLWVPVSTVTTVWTWLQGQLAMSTSSSSLGEFPHPVFSFAILDIGILSSSSLPKSILFSYFPPTEVLDCVLLTKTSPQAQLSAL